MAYDATGLAEFIEMRSDLCDGDVLLQGVINLSSCLRENPGDVIGIIKNHPFIPATFLLEDLSEKINKQNRNPMPNCVNSLALLFEACFEQLIEACIYNIHDLERFLKVMPTYTDRTLEAIASNEVQLQRILNASHTDSPEEVLKALTEKYPSHVDCFTELSGIRTHRTFGL